MVHIKKKMFLKIKEHLLKAWLTVFNISISEDTCEFSAHTDRCAYIWAPTVPKAQ